MECGYESQAWAESHAALSDELQHLFDKLSYVFSALVRIEYDAPWRREGR